jgi:hypothetical protein
VPRIQSQKYFTFSFLVRNCETWVSPNFRVGFSAGPGKTCCRNKRQQEEPPVGLEAGSQPKSQGKWLGVGGPSVGLYVPLLEFNPEERGLVEVQLRYAPQSTPYAPDIGLAFNA